MPLRDTLAALMPTFFPAVKSEGMKNEGMKSGGGSLPLPSGGGRSFWWGNGSGPIYPGGGLNVGRSIDYVQAAGDVSQNSAVAACLNWIGTNWGDAPVKVGKLVGNKFSPEEHHPLEDLLDQPNEDFNGKWLQWALTKDYFCFGRAYAHVVMGTNGPKELQYLPAQCVTAIPDNNGRLSHYEYKPKQTAIRVDKRYIVHFRFGVDPNNVLEGVSPLGPAMVEIVSDNACARYPANMMHHGGLPPGVLTLKPPAAGSNMQPLTPEMAGMLTDTFNEKLQTEPGKIRLIPAPLELVLLGWKPNEVALNDLREEPETRIAAQFGLPCLVVGLRAGLIRSTYSNTEQAVKAAWTNCLVPLQKYFASEWTRQLLPLYPDSDGLVVAYDHTQVGVLQEDANAKREQARSDYESGLLTHEEARSEQGRDPLPDSEKSKLKGQSQGAEDDSTDEDEDVGSLGAKSLAIKEEEIASWITVHGRHIPIGKDGEPIGGPLPGTGKKPGSATVKEKTPSPSEKSMLAKASAAYVGKDIQRYSEGHNEPVLAHGVGGNHLPDNEPVDVMVAKAGKVTAGVELKTMVRNKARKITMSTEAMQRKSKWQDTHKAAVHTVVFDDTKLFDRDGPGKHGPVSDRQIFYRRGFGSFRVDTMHPVKDMAELKTLIESPESSLPSKAQPPPGQVPKFAD